jgi:hypothetical protein
MQALLLPSMYSAQEIFQHHFTCKKVRTILDKIGKEAFARAIIQ